MDLSGGFRSTPPREGRPALSISSSIASEFRSTPHARGDFARRTFCATPRRFDPRPHARGDRRCPAGLAAYRSFDPRPHARGDARAVRTESRMTGFRSTPPREGRQAGAGPSLLRGRFDPRPHARGDIEREFSGSPAGWVSIHAPTRGATSRISPPTISRPVSIHAPTRGATAPTPHCRSWEGVSIHAPTRGATHPPCEEGRAASFRSTPPREGRPLTGSGRSAYSSFDPRPHARGDVACLARLVAG